MTRRKKVALALVLAGVAALVTTPLVLLYTSVESFELLPADEALVAKLEARRLVAAQSGDFAALAWTLTAGVCDAVISPWAEAVVKDREVTIRDSRDLRVAIDRLVRAVNAPDREASAWARLGHRLSRDRPRVRYRLHADRIEFVLDEEPLPARLGRADRCDRFVSLVDGAALVWIPTSAALTRGSGEMPTIDFIDGFLIDRDEVTIARYRRFLDEVGRSNHATCGRDEPPAKDHRPLLWDTPEYGRAHPDEECPVTGVDWWDACAYAGWAGRRLPGDAEWQLAARGPAGSAAPRHAPNLAGDEDGFEHAAPARVELGEGWRLRSAIGNAAEWTPDACWRGGSWLTPRGRSSYSLLARGTRDHRELGLGFRCAQDWRIDGR